MCERPSATASYLRAQPYRAALVSRQNGYATQLSRMTLRRSLSSRTLLNEACRNCSSAVHPQPTSIH
jgi:hypothetical protein